MYVSDSYIRKALRLLVHKNSPQSLERRREEIFATFLFNPWHVTEFKVMVVVSIVDTECPVITDSGIFLANDRIDTRTMLDTLCRKDFVACPALKKKDHC